MKSWQERLAAAGLLALFAGLVAAGLPHHSPTVDEFAHLPAGYYYWKTGDFSLYSRNPPLVKMIAAAPWLVLKPVWGYAAEDYADRGWRAWRYAAGLMNVNAGQYPRLVFWGRVPIVVLAVLLGLGVWRWSRRLYGPAGGVLSLVGFCFWPDLLAHAGLATVDMGSSLFIFAAVFFGLRFLDRPNLPRALAAGTLLGLSLLAKFTALLLVPLVLGLPILARTWPRPDPHPGPNSFPWLRVGRNWVALGLAAWLVLLAGYGFECDPYAFSRMPRVSHVLQSAQKLFPSLLLPLPYDYLDGLDLQILDSEVTIGEFPNYLCGQWYRGQKWYYFPVALAVKTPLPILLGFFLALLLPRRSGEADRAPKRFRPDEIALLTIMVWLYFGITGRNHLQIGVRYLLPLFPFGLVLMGRLATLHWPPGWNRWYRAILAGLGLWLLVGTLRIYPHFLAYFNELAGGPDRGYKVLINSNLDWGQDLPGLADYMRDHGIVKVHLAYFGHADPAIYGIQYDLFQGPGRPGLTAISANYLMGFPYPITYTNPVSRLQPESTAPYRERQPLLKIGYSIFLFQD